MKRAKVLRIKAELFDEMFVVAMNFGDNVLGKDFDINLSKFEEFNSRTYEELRSVPEMTIDYWQDALKRNRPLLWFQFIPHIFLKGNLAIEKEDIVILSDIKARVLKIGNGPARAMLRLDLGDQWQDEG